MRTLSTIPLLITFTLFGCGQNHTYMERTASDFFSNKEDHFGFLIFDKSKVDTFFKAYSPIQLQNNKLKNAFVQLSKSDTTQLAIDTFNLGKHTDNPKHTDYELAKNVLKATEDKNGDKYFQGSVTYLFFFECLPNEFQYKWVQTRLGDFKFNVTFFNRLRTKCEVFDKIIYGETGYWDKNIQSVFKHDIFNEINKESAQLIKNCIVEDTTFNDNRLKADKENFIMFLDKTIQSQWRMFLIDKN